MEFPTFKNEFHKPGIELLPHRAPFLFVDELISADETGALGKYTFTDSLKRYIGHHLDIDSDIHPGQCHKDPVTRVTYVEMKLRVMQEIRLSVFASGYLEVPSFRIGFRYIRIVLDPDPACPSDRVRIVLLQKIHGSARQKIISYAADFFIRKPGGISIRPAAAHVFTALIIPICYVRLEITVRSAATRIFSAAGLRPCTIYVRLIALFRL